MNILTQKKLVKLKRSKEILYKAIITSCCAIIRKCFLNKENMQEFRKHKSKLEKLLNHHVLAKRLVEYLEQETISYDPIPFNIFLKERVEGCDVDKINKLSKHRLFIKDKNIEEKFTLPEILEMMNVIDNIETLLNYFLELINTVDSFGKSEISDIMYLQLENMNKIVGDIVSTYPKLSQDAYMLENIHTRYSLKFLEKDLESNNSHNFIRSGFAFDREIIINNKYTIIGGRPSDGKTSLLVSMIYNIKRLNNDIDVLFFTSETDSADILSRFLSIESGVPLSHIMRCEMNDEERYKVHESYQKICNRSSHLSNIMIRDKFQTINSTLLIIKSMLSNMSKDRRLLVVVDYIQKLATSECETSLQRTAAVVKMSEALQNLTRENEKISILCSSQLSRQSDSRKRENAAPNASDLAESGSLEVDADSVIIFSNNCRKKSLHIVKNRSGRNNMEYEISIDDKTLFVSDINRKIN
ncbi:MAG: DnaB-like helicase C-terminal domain-containing protein [Paraclostridium sp.]